MSIAATRASRPAQVSLARSARRPASLRHTVGGPCRMAQRLRAQAEEVSAAEEAPVAEQVDAAAAPEESAEEAPVVAPLQDPTGYSLNVLWLEKSIGLAVDQVLGKQEQKAPVTEFFFWPKGDAWEQLNVALESKKWVDSRNRVLLMNQATDIINFWQEEDRKTTIEDARARYPNVFFQGN